MEMEMDKTQALTHYTALAAQAAGRTFRCRIARIVGPSVQTLSYVGPLDRIPAGWSIVMRRVVGGAK
jgi:hypothetical protein